MNFQFKDGDPGFLGIDMTRERDQLEPGLLALGQNTRLRRRRAQQRPGTMMPGDFNPAAGFTNFFVGSSVFNNPNGDELLLVAPANAQYVYALQFGRDPYIIPYSGLAITAYPKGNGVGTVQLVQSFNHVQLLWRPYPAIVPPLTGRQLVWDGTGDTDHNGVANSSWFEIALTGGKTLIPRGYFNAEPFMDRLIYYQANTPSVTNRDTWIVSDIEDYTSYDQWYQKIRTNTAQSDFITRIFGYFKGSVIIFKSQSIHQAFFQPTFPFSVTQREVSHTLGSYGNKMPLEIGGDVIFWSPPHGFFRLAEVDQENTVTLPVPISQDVQPVIDAINVGTTSTWGCSVALDNYAFFGVGIGVGVRGLNTVLVYNMQTQKWESGGDTWRDPSFLFHALHVVTYAGVRRVFALDYISKAVYLLYEGVYDELISGQWSVPYKIETRGYVGQDPVAWKRFLRAKVAISTLDPSITFSVISDGFNEVRIITPEPITKDRTQFYTHGHKRFDSSTDDPLEPKREDYSVGSGLVDNFAFEDFENLPDGPIDSLPGSSPPIAGGDHQQSLERYVTRTSGRWQSMRVENDSGSCDVLAVSVEGNYTMDTSRTAA